MTSSNGEDEMDSLRLELANTTLTLIDDNLTHREAEEILLRIFQDEINFYKVKNWSCQERYGKSDENAQTMIPTLKGEMERLKAILMEAKNKDKKLVVSSEIKIALVDR